MIEIKRIRFYARKARQFALDRRPRHQRNRYRYDRLMAYKRALYERLEVDDDVTD